MYRNSMEMGRVPFKFPCRIRVAVTRTFLKFQRCLAHFFFLTKHRNDEDHDKSLRMIAKRAPTRDRVRSVVPFALSNVIGE